MPRNTKNPTTIYRASFKHWRSGKVVRAKDHGYKGFPIGLKAGSPKPK